MAFMDDFFEPIRQELKKLKDRLDRQPQIRWGVVFSVSPLKVVFDADILATPADVAVSVSTLVDPSLLTVNDRVQIVSVYNKHTVIGVAGGFDIPAPASQSEVDAGTDTLRFVTPKTLAMLGFSEKTSGSQSGITTQTQVTGVSVPFTLGHTTTATIDVLFSAYSSGANDVIAVTLKDGAATLVTRHLTANSAGTATTNSHSFRVRIEFAAGSHTITLHVARVVGSGTVTVLGAAGDPVQVLVQRVIG